MKKIISHYNFKLKKEETEELKRLYLKNNYSGDSYETDLIYHKH